MINDRPIRAGFVDSSQSPFLSDEKISSTSIGLRVKNYRRNRGRNRSLCIHYTDTDDTDTLLKIQATNLQESMTIDNTMTHCIPRKINKSHKLKMDQLT